MVDVDRDWIKLHRKLLVNDLWRSEPFSKGQAWVDLLLLANHAEGFFFNRGVRIDVNRGQVGMSELQLSLRWKWSRTKTRNFFKLLEKEQQIEQHKNNVNSLITILNYDTYQPKKHEEEQQKDNRKTTEEQQKDTNKKNKNVKKEEEKEVKDLSSPDDEDQTSEKIIITKKKRKLTGKRLDTFLEFWDAFAYKSGKAEAADAWADIPSLTVSLVAKIIDAAKKEAVARPSIRARGGIPKMAQGWLSGSRWQDEERESEPTRKRGLSDGDERAFLEAG